MSTPHPRRKLPVNPSLEHLQKQAKRRVKQTPGLQLGAAQHQLAQEYGCRNWAELVRMVEAMLRPHDQVDDPNSRHDAMPQAARAGDLERVKLLLTAGDFTPHTLDQTLAHVLWYGDESTWAVRRASADLLIAHGADPDGRYDSGEYGPIIFGAARHLQPDALEYLIAAGADVTAPPIETKYGLQCVMSHVLGTYIRGANTRKHRCLEILAHAGGAVPLHVEPVMLAIHRGDTAALAECLARDPALVSLRFTNFPFGNLSLRGATLLHCAAEFGEVGAMAELIKHGADINALASVTDGIGGQTPLYHAISCAVDGDDASLRYFLKISPRKSPCGVFGTKIKKRIENSAARLNFSVRVTWQRFGETAPHPMGPLDFIAHLAKKAGAPFRENALKAMGLLLSLSPVGQHLMSNLTHGARQALVQARNVAKRLGCDCVDTEHALLTLTEMKDDLLARIIADLGTSAESLRVALLKERGPITPSSATEKTPQLYSASLRKALAIAAKEAHALGHGHIGTAHLLAGLMREENGLAGRVLRAAVCDAKRVRTAIAAAHAGHSAN